jgi:hypothetical protein
MSPSQTGGVVCSAKLDDTVKCTAAVPRPFFLYFAITPSGRASVVPPTLYRHSCTGWCEVIVWDVEIEQQGGGQRSRWGSSREVILWASRLNTRAGANAANGAAAGYKRRPAIAVVGVREAVDWHAIVAGCCGVVVLVTLGAWCVCGCDALSVRSEGAQQRQS